MIDYRAKFKSEIAPLISDYKERDDVRLEDVLDAIANCGAELITLAKENGDAE